MSVPWAPLVKLGVVETPEHSTILGINIPKVNQEVHQSPKSDILGGAISREAVVTSCSDNKITKESSQLMGDINPTLRAQPVTTFGIP